MKMHLAVLGLLCVPGFGHADVLHVPAQYATIQAAMDAAQRGDEIQVAAGAYSDCTHEVVEYSTTILHCVVMKDGVALIGAGSDATIIDAQTLGRVILADSCGAGTRLEGFTITGGFTPNPRHGAGLRCTYSQLDVSHVVFSGNRCYGNGGGAAVVRGTNTFRNCVFSENYVAYYGGGLYSVYSSSVFENCRFTENSALHGGGMICDFGYHPVFTSCLIDHNTGRTNGGGIWTSNGSGADFRNCTIADNVSAQGASFYSLTSSVVFSNCILAFGAGSATVCPGGVSFTCCAIYGHSGGDVFCGTDLGGNFSLDPLFNERDAGDYTLQAKSPCLPGNHPSGCNDLVIGAFPTIATPVVPMSWGRVKAIYRP